MLISKSLHNLTKDRDQRDSHQNLQKRYIRKIFDCRTNQELMGGQTNPQNCQLKPSFYQVFPHQPNDLQSNDEMKVPTLTNVASYKNNDQQINKEQSKKVMSVQEDNSLLSPSVNVMMNSHLLSETKKQSYDNGRLRVILTQVKQRLLNSIHFSKYNDPLVTHEFKEGTTNRIINLVSPFYYYYFTLFMFLTTFISNFFTIILIPLHKVFHLQESVSQIFYYFKIFAILLDLYFQRGPYKLFRGKITQNYKNQNKVFLDLFRLIILLINYNLNLESRLLTILLIVILILVDMIRIAEPFENLYISTQYIVMIIQLWASIIVSLTCTLKKYLTMKMINPCPYIQVTQFPSQPIMDTFVNMQCHLALTLNEDNRIVVSVFSLICYFCYVYTLVLLWIWMKPNIEIQEEKQKLLKGFIKHFQEKCKDQDLLRRCYSYLDYRIDEDLGRAKEQLMKKLSPSLQDEIDLALRTKMLERIELMHKFSPQFKQQLLYMIEQVTFNPEDNVLIEHQAEDLSLYYILKGEVKVQFQGSSLANNKSSVTKLVEGQTFGQHSFISGIPSNISIFSCGVTTLMKLKRSDFIEILSHYPKDNERFSMMRDNSLYNQSLFDCYYCKIQGDYIVECRHLQYFPQRQNVLERYLYSRKQHRKPMVRKQKRYLTLRNLNRNQERLRSIINHKQSQEAISEEFPDISQLPYSENQINSASQMSNSNPFLKASQDNYVSGSNFNGDNIEQQQQNNEEEEADEVGITIPKIQARRKMDDSHKNIHRTAGFMGNLGNGSVLDKDEKEILLQLQDTSNKDAKQFVLNQANRNSPNMLTFQYQKDTSPQIQTDYLFLELNQQQQNQDHNQKGTLGQLSNRSRTCTNSFSRDISNNQSSNSRQNRSLKQSRDKVRKTNSINTLSDDNKLRQKSGTKQSNLGQQSAFQALATPENQELILNDVIFNQFECMMKYKIYYPHNNFNCVIQRYKNQFEMSNFKIKKFNYCGYSLKCFVASKIKRIQKLIRRQ
ncbi:unnamed protein product (macronuclear) [Paramecium tetraurelia]|uniref:Cyclic nucleotide-binding domain-containing protein n=1 Tax=Paramecium tetraurelia TaxID=5888 RepID=A0BM24_PARTE|nr:uncharacterized protein GSPATT00030225001 [Paramecium tetraurelia]CAK59591.1 unnamed protein product [Paramecium tetraurelia]|eukprot:XP_001426989.1 hypothetical protein (macronuclear) [Paramecium tetraurelia strain d4-2]